MNKLLSCEFNMDTVCVELRFSDGSMISIDCIAVENEVADNLYERSELDYLIYNAPLEYAALILNGDPERYLKTVCQSANNNKGNVNASSIKARMAELCATTPVPEMYAEDYEQLMTLQSLMTKNDEQSKIIKALKAALDEKLKEKYAVLTVEGIKELLVNKKWYYSIYDGIDALYVAISHNITDRVTELAERYEDTLPELSDSVADYEAKVKSHLERMGFKW